jgi:hypothetical protein
LQWWQLGTVQDTISYQLVGEGSDGLSQVGFCCSHLLFVGFVSFVWGFYFYFYFL